MRLFGHLRLGWANFLMRFSHVSAFRKFLPFVVSEVRQFRTFEVSGLSKVGRDICRDLGRSRLARANFLSQAAEFLGFRRGRPTSAPFRPAALGIRQLPESYFARSRVSEVSTFLPFEVSELRRFRSF